MIGVMNTKLSNSRRLLTEREIILFFIIFGNRIDNVFLILSPSHDSVHRRSSPCQSGIYKYADWTRETVSPMGWQGDFILAKKFGNPERSIAFDWPIFFVSLILLDCVWQYIKSNSIV